MSGKHVRKEKALDDRSIEIRFSSPVIKAFGDLVNSVQSSGYFDADVLAIVEDWAAGKAATAHDVLIAWPKVAEETFRHIHATEDEKARDAWREIANQMPEQGFTLSSIIQRRR